jgi:hypothetical protein
MNYAEQAITGGLTPGRLEWCLRNGCAIDEIAGTYQTDVITVQLLMTRWALSHFSGREKSDVVLVRKPKGVCL